VLYDRYTAKVYQKCMGMTRDQELAKDLTHDIFLKAFVNLSLDSTHKRNRIDRQEG